MFKWFDVPKEYTNWVGFVSCFGMAIFFLLCFFFKWVAFAIFGLFSALSWVIAYRLWIKKKDA